MTRVILWFSAFLVLVQAAPAQSAWVARRQVGPSPLFPVDHSQAYLPSAANPAGVGTFVRTTILPQMSGGLGPVVNPGGGHAFDSVTGTFFTTEGTNIAQDAHPDFPAPIGGTSFSAVPNFAMGSTVTGLAVDSYGISQGLVPTLFMIDGAGNFAGFSTTIPPVQTTGVMTLPFTPMSAITGLGFDPATQLLWVTDTTGQVYSVMTNGMHPPGTMQPVATLPAGSFTGLIRGLTVNSTTSIGSDPPPACANQMAGFNICVVDSVGAVFDAMNGTKLCTAVPASSMVLGLAFASDGQVLPGSDPAAPIPLTLDRAFVRFLGPDPRLRIIGAPPNTSGFWLFSTCPLNPPDTSLPPYTFWIDTMTPGYAWQPLIVNASGVATLSMPVQGGPAGFQFTAQAVMSSPPVLSDALALNLAWP